MRSTEPPLKNQRKYYYIGPYARILQMGGAKRIKEEQTILKNFCNMGVKFMQMVYYILRNSSLPHKCYPDEILL